MARADLDFVHRTLQENHPGAIDSADPAFRRTMEEGYRVASASARKARSLADEKRLLARYAAGFADIHLQVDFNTQSRHMAWPGIVINRTGDRYVVSGRAAQWPVPLPAIGAELRACDGRTPDSMMNEDVLPGLFNLLDSPAVKAMYMYYFFLDDDLAPRQYRRCTFAEADAVREMALEWNPIARPAYYKQWEAANPPISKHSTIDQLAADTWWVHLPEFAPGPEQEAELKALIARMPTLRDAALVVFDTRGNGGGDSQWGDDVLAALYGKPFLDAIEARQGEQGYSEWRVSKGNLEHLAAIIARHRRQFGNGSDAPTTFTNLYARMEKSLAKGGRFERQSLPTPAPAPATVLAAAALSQARAVLVTDSNCVSSCLDFADAVRALPGAVHLGQTTGADTLYMDVRTVDLPSALGTLTFAQKVYRGRQRGNNQPWVPSRQYPGPIADTEQVKAWVLQQLR
ncbi:MAG: S41 family peptidase [Massilia sp.]